MGMKEKALIPHTRLKRLFEIAELARHGAPEDRARIDHTIRLVIQGLRALAQAQEAVQQAAILTEKAEASIVRRQNDRISK
jgi:hypothetical protein